MGKCFVFTDDVLAADSKDSQKTLAYLKERKHELIQVSALSNDSQEENLRQLELADYFDFLFSNISLESLNHMFFSNLKRDINYRICQRNPLLWHCKEALWVEDSHCIIVTDQLKICKQAEGSRWHSIYYDNLESKVVGGHKIKQLSTLTHIY